MTVKRPYRKTFRQFIDVHYSLGSRLGHEIHLKFAKSPSHNICGFKLMLKDLKEQFDFIEPADNNLT